MATAQEYIDFVISQLEGTGILRARKMFGEYLIYVNEKPLVLVCDNICYVRKVPVLASLLQNAECGFPYEGAKEHYILEIEHASEAREVIKCLEAATGYPEPRKSGKRKRPAD